MIKQILFSAVFLFAGYFASGNSSSVISIETRGAGHPMILIHGMACSADVWEDVARYYEDQYEIHLVTISGFGNRGAIESSHILKTVRDELIAYVKETGLNKPVMMGHSMGGFLVLWAAAEQPGLFGKIISVDGLPYFPVLAMPGITAETAGPIANMISSQMQNSDPAASRAMQEMTIASMIGNESKRKAVIEMGMNSNGSVISQAMGEMYTNDIRNEVSAIKSDVLVLGSWYGYRQFGTTMESARAGFEAQFNVVANARVEMAPTALHFIFYDQPEWFFGKVDNFLGTIR